MSEEAATPTGGAEVSARPDASAEQKPLSITDRLKAQLFAPQESEPSPERVATPVADADPEPAESKAAPVKAKAKEVVDEPAEDAGDEQTEASYETVNELAEALGWDLEKVLNLEAPTKIDGKEGKARLRDLIKGYQLEGHLNQKLMTHAEEQKAFQTERQNFAQTSQHKLQQLDAGVKIAQKLLEGEFSQVNWQELQDTDPVAFSQKFAGFQQRQAQIGHVAGLLGQEHQTVQQQAAQQQQAYQQEQMTLLESKVPEWSTPEARQKSLAEMSPVFSEAYGITPQELGNVVDHRQLLIARDAWQWRKLQQSKPATLNKIKTAPKLIKPGAQQSRAAQDNFIASKERDRLRSTGKVADAKAPLKRLLFNS